MATTPFEVSVGITGLTIEIDFGAEGSDIVAQNQNLSEYAVFKGVYHCDIINLAAGRYKFRVKDGSDNTIATGFVNHKDTVTAERPQEDSSRITEDVVASIPTATLQQLIELCFTYDATATFATADNGSLVKQIVNNVDVSGGSTGSGARTVIITVNDGTNPLENAIVRASQGAETYFGTTNVDGEIVFALDDATWNVAITKPGYSFTPTTLVVNGDETQTYSMVEVAIPAPAGANFATGYVYCYDNEGNLISNVNIFAQQLAGPGDDGFAYNTQRIQFTSVSGGLASFNAFVQGGRYNLWRNAGEKIVVNIPESSNFALPEILGR